MLAYIIVLSQRSRCLLLPFVITARSCVCSILGKRCTSCSKRVFCVSSLRERTTPVGGSCRYPPCCSPTGWRAGRGARRRPARPWGPSSPRCCSRAGPLMSPGQSCGLCHPLRHCWTGCSLGQACSGRGWA